MEQFLKSNFTSHGRLHRRAFIVRYLLATLIKLIPKALMLLFFSFHVGWVGEHIMGIYNLFNMIFAIFFSIFQLLLCIRRFHDIDISGRLTTWIFLLVNTPSFITIIVPIRLLPSGLIDLYYVVYMMSIFMNFLFHLALFLRRGTDGDNRYGQDPLAVAKKNKDDGENNNKDL